MRHQTFSVFVLLLLSPSILHAAPPTLPGWNVNWFDEFDGTSINTTLWDVINTTNTTNNSLQAYLPSQVTVSGGNLVITATDQPFGGLPYRSGQVISRASRRHGKWEVRAKLPTSQGQWPAIWLLPDAGVNPWPSQGEIDIMENRGNEPFKTSSAFHYGTNPPFNHNFVYAEHEAQVAGTANNFHNDFHTYGVEWSSDVLRFFVDGVNYYNVHDADVGGFLSSQTAGMETVINNAIGGNFLPNPDASTVWPQEMLIDYVHMYSPSGAADNRLLENGSFDGTANPDHSPLAGWTTFGTQNFGNVSPHNEAVRSGSHSLKLFGQFNGSTNYSGVEQGVTITAGEEVRAIVHDYIRSADSIAGTSNQVTLNIDYYSKKHGKYGSPDYISTESITIADGSTAQDTWLAHELRSTAPAGAVEARMAIAVVQPNGQGGAVHFDDIAFGKRGGNTLVWDETGNGIWNTSRWNGTGPDFPVDFDRAVIRTDRVGVVGSQAAFETVVESGELLIAGQLTSDVTVAAAGTIVNRGTITGDLAVEGSVAIESVDTLTVNGVVDLTQADLLIGDAYAQTRGTYTGNFSVMEANQIVGTLPLSSGDHLGDGLFLESLLQVGQFVVADLYSAIPGDANGDGVNNGADFIIWNNFKFTTGTDWTSGDFNGDGVTNGADFIIWNNFKFTTADRLPAAVPEPQPILWAVLAFFCLGARRAY